MTLVLSFFAAAAVALALHEISLVLLRRMLDRRGPGQRIVKRGSGMTRLAAVLLGVAVALPVAEFDPAIVEWVRRFLKVGIITLLAWAAFVMINSAADHLARRYRLDVEDNLEARRIHTQLHLFRRIGLIMVVFVGAGAILMSFPTVQAIGFSLFASAGVAGIVLGLAARPVLTNIIAGIQIALTQPIRIDDVVIVEEEWGWIEEITTTYVVVRVWDLRRLIVPLSHFIEKPFQNWTRESASIIGSVTWHVDYMAPVDRMREKLAEFVANNPLWDEMVANLQVVDAEKSTIKVRAIVSSRNSSDAWDLRCEIREKMISWLRAKHPDALPRARASIDIERSRPVIT